VLVAKLFRLDIRHALDSKVEMSPGLMYVDVSARAAEGEHTAACEAIGTGPHPVCLCYSVSAVCGHALHVCGVCDMAAYHVQDFWLRLWRHSASLASHRPLYQHSGQSRHPAASRCGHQGGYVAWDSGLLLKNA
jgi:hypothetical protein